LYTQQNGGWDAMWFNRVTKSSDGGFCVRAEISKSREMVQKGLSNSGETGWLSFSFKRGGSVI
jgi:hypothetical protein